MTEPQAEAVTRPMALYLEYMAVGEQQLFEARKIIELNAVEAAADNITEDGIEQLRTALVIEREASSEELPSLQRDLHVQIAKLSGNPVLSLFVTVLNDLLEDRTAPMVHISQAVAEPVHRAHESIVEAIISGDGALARHRMMRHLDAIHDWLA